MGIYNLDAKTTLRTIECGTCGVWHAIPETLYQKCLQEGGYWHCPNGHSRGFSEGSIYNQLKEEKKRRERAEARTKAAREKAALAERRRAAQKGINTKLKKRIAAGVCPCCNRTFKQLAVHMKNKHPDYKIEKECLAK